MSFALVDCNSFFCSCEKVFRPDLKNRPVIVLSNNDGCAVALTSDLKALGIQVGTPYFKIKSLVKKHNIAVFSSNFALYSDMSQRVMNTLQDFTPDMEIYSIDEAFLSLNGLAQKDLTQYGLNIKSTVKQYTGIPVSVGIAPTKVLAKAANHLAKKYQRLNGVYELNDLSQLGAPLKMIPIEKLWGVGRKSAEKLKRMNIHTAWELKNASLKKIKKELHLPGERLVMELNGESCMDLDLNQVGKKQILSSRSFGKPVAHYEQLRQSASFHATRVAEKLRSQNSVSKKVGVFIQTNPHGNEPQYFKSTSINLLTHSDSTQTIIKAVTHGLKSIYKSGYSFKKCGVYVSELVEKNQLQLNLFDTTNHEHHNKLMQAIDSINNNNGRDSVQFASCGIEQKWKMRSELRSPAYTTRWPDLIRVG